MTLRYGIIGSGMMGQEHIRNIQLLDGAEVSALADPDEGMRVQASTLCGAIDVHSDYREMLSAGNFDVLVIAAPNDLHYEIMCAAIDAGKPILCEKPLCTTTSDCADLLSRAAHRDSPVWVAMEYRYMPPIQSMLENLRDGDIGKLQMVAIREHRFPFLEKVGDWNRFNKRTGGTLVEKCCHFWDLMRLVIGADPVRVYASAAADINHKGEVYDGEVPDMLDNAFVTVDFKNGVRAMLDLCMFAEGARWQEEITLIGSSARMDARVPGPPRFSGGIHLQSELELFPRSGKSSTLLKFEVDEAIQQAGDHHGSTFHQHRRFFDMVREGRSNPEVSLHDGMWAVRIGEAAEMSARENRVVQLDEGAMS